VYLNDRLKIDCPIGPTVQLFVKHIEIIEDGIHIDAYRFNETESLTPILIPDSILELSDRTIVDDNCLIQIDNPNGLK